MWNFTRSKERLNRCDLLVTRSMVAGAAAVLSVIPDDAAAQADPLPSWSDRAPRQAIVRFVERVTRQDSPDFAPVPERVAVFDNDGTHAGMTTEEFSATVDD